jgi:hypothetical protein
MPEFVRSKIGQLSDFVRDNLKIKISGWLELYFDQSADLTPLMEKTFSTIESLETKLLIMLDEIAGLIRLRGAGPEQKDMDFMWALGQYIPESKYSRYLISGSQPGLMDLLLSRETAPLLGRFIRVEVWGLEEKGSEDLIRDKIKRRISKELVEELKNRTRLWPLYLQAYCLAANNYSGEIKSVEDLDGGAFGALFNHFLYLESLLTDDELKALLGISKFGSGSVGELYPKLEISYGSLQTAFRRLELKGFAKKVAEGTYEPLDPLFQEWLAQTYKISPLNRTSAKKESGEP